MARQSLPVVRTAAELLRLQQWLRASSTPQQVVLRARIIERAAQGQSDQQIARELKGQRRTAALWRRRVRAQGIGCVWELAPGRGRKPRHRHQEFLKFLRRLDAEFPAATSLHLILDNYGTHGHEKVRRWLARHPRLVLHFIPTSASWLNLVERWFAELSQKAVRRGVFRSVAELERAIADFLAAWNTHPVPFVWTANAEKILEKLARCRRRLEQIQPGCTQPKHPAK